MTHCDTFKLTGSNPEGRVQIFLEGIEGTDFTQTKVGEATIQELQGGNSVRRTGTFVFHVPETTNDGNGHTLGAGRYRLRMFAVLFSGDLFSIGDRSSAGVHVGNLTIEELAP